MAFKTRYFVYTAKNFETGLTDITAKIRRNGAYVLGTDVTPIALTELDNGRYQLTLNNTQFTNAGGAGDYQIDVDSASKSAPVTRVVEITENDEDTIYALNQVMDGKLDVIDANVDQALVDIAAVKSDTASIKLTVEDTNTEVNDPVTGLVNIKALIDQIQSVVTNISNVTRFNAPVPKKLIKLDVGTKSYKVPVRVFDTAGNLEDVDSNQIQLTIKDNAGVSRDSYINGFVSQPHYITRLDVGKYEFQLDIPDTAPLENLIFEFTYNENTIPLSYVATSEVIPESDNNALALEATSQAILTDTADMQPKVTTILTAIEDATNGLVAIKNAIDVIDGVADGIAAELANGTYGLAALRTEIDTKASQTSVTAVTTNIDDNVKGAGFVQAEDSLHQISTRVYTGGTLN